MKTVYLCGLAKIVTFFNLPRHQVLLCIAFYFYALYALPLPKNGEKWLWRWVHFILLLLMGAENPIYATATRASFPVAAPVNNLV